MLSLKMSNSQLEQRSAVARRIMQHLGFEAKQLDVFTKKQKNSLLQLVLDTPSVKAEKDRTVPRQYVKQLRETLHHVMKNDFYDKSEHKLTYYDMATVGIPFCLNLREMHEKGKFSEAPQRELAEQLYAKILELDFDSLTNFMWVFYQMHLETGAMSQPNYRLYGFYFRWEGLENSSSLYGHHRLIIYITALESLHKHFEHNGTRRIAYRMQQPDQVIKMGNRIVVLLREIFPNALNGDTELNLYVQSHALRRFKERLNEIHPKGRNVLLHHFLVENRQVVQTPAGTQLACIFSGGLMGYFSFFIQGDDLVVSTFLPVASSRTPEGKKFCDRFGFSKNELAYLGMDKQTFYLRIDFDKIPVLKQAMIDSGLWEMKEKTDAFFRDIDRLDEFPIDEQRTQFVANFFKKWEEWKSEDTENVVETP
jgi:hypothetical protein